MDASTYDQLHELYDELLAPSNTDFEKEVAKLRRAGRLKATAEQVKQFLESINATVFASLPPRTGEYKYDSYNFALIADLMDVSNMAHGNGGYNWILNIIEWHSRYVWSFPLKTKSSSDTDKYGRNPIVEAFKHVLDILSPDKETGPDILIVTDQGTEFKGLLTELLDEYPWVFRRYSTAARKSTEPVERFNRTLRDMLKRVIRVKGSWKPYLDQKIKEYNTRVHSGIEEKPIDVLLQILLDYEDGVSHAKTDVTPKPLKYPVGSKVRLVVKHDIFAKKSMAPKYSDAVYTVTGFSGGYYDLVDSKGDKRRAVDVELMLIDLPDEVVSAAEKRGVNAQPEYHEARAESSKQRKNVKALKEIAFKSKRVRDQVDPEGKRPRNAAMKARMAMLEQFGDDDY